MWCYWRVLAGKYFQEQCPRSDFPSPISNLNHPSERLLCLYYERGAPVKFKNPPWYKAKAKTILTSGTHKYCFKHLDFLQEEFVEMIKKGQWVILPASSVSELPGLRISLPDCVPQRDCFTWWICDYSWSDMNSETLPLAMDEAMQSGHTLYCILREILLANPELGPVYIIIV